MLAAPAIAQDEVFAPPGNSGVEEYLEVVPGAGGETPARGGKTGSGSGSRSTVSQAQALGSTNAKKLDAMGADGKAAATAAAAGSPTDLKTARQRAKSKPLGDAAPGKTSIAAQTGGGDRVKSVARALGGDGGGMGLLFPILLGATLSLAVAVAVGRFLRRA